MSTKIPAGSSVQEVTKLLYKAMNAGSVFHNMGVRTDGEKISLFEEAFGVNLPESFKAFLAEFNGGFLADEEANWYWMNGEYNTCEQMCSRFLSIEEIIEEYESMMLDDWKLQPGFEGFYPYIPFYITKDNEKLVFVNNDNDDKESFIYAAFHDYPASDWFVVKKTFTEFLIDYINTDGKPNLYAVEMDYYAADNLDGLDNKQAEIDDSTGRIKRHTAYLTLFPEDTVTYNSRGNAYRDAGKYEEALADYKKSLELDPKFALTYYCRGSLMLSLKKARQSLIDFDSACQLEPNDPLFLTGRADAFYELKKLDEALADCNQAIEVDDRYYIAYSIRHAVHLSMGETAKAEVDAAMIEELSTEDEY